MIIKPKLLFRTEDNCNFNQGFMRPWADLWFDMVEYQPGVDYDRTYTVLTTYQQEFDPNAWYRSLEQQGLRIVVDHLYDSDVDTPSLRLSSNKIELRSGNWMWYHSACLATHNGYNQYRPQLSYTHDFLCLMNKIRDHRDRVMNELAPELGHARWSYVDRGRSIGDAEERNTQTYWLFYMNPEWYDSTCWHLAVESYMRSDLWFASPTHPNYRTEISEKSYKPLAYFQPFVVLGSNHTLNFLQRQGFETFSNLWPEHYDNIESDSQRADSVLSLVRDIVKTYNRHCTGWDKETQQKLQHNHNRFFDLDRVYSGFCEEIVADIMEFIES